jgi:lycopene cyclase CruP
MSITEQILASIPGSPLVGLRRTDQLWHALRTQKFTSPTVITQQSESTPEAPAWDGVICGGTLGILIGTALVQKGWRIAVLEQGQLQGRAQEWNISRSELQVFIDLGLLSEAELAQAIVTDYNPARVQFHEGPELWVEGVLNIGVDPQFLLATLKAKFLELGGQLFEYTAFTTAMLDPNGIDINVTRSSDQSLITLRSRLLIDAMGHRSPIVQQARQGQQPESVCLVVGTCAQGFPPNPTGDLIRSFTPIENDCQYFWEAFPAKDGRTTYLFTYLDTHPDRLSLEALFEAYFHYLPQYQTIELAQLQFVRAMFGFFPSYRQSPLSSPWARVLPVGDSSGGQSPLSFGGFGAMVRHLSRLTIGIDQALHVDALSAKDLALLQPYQPSLSVTWLFQKTMSANVGQSLEPNQINQLLTAVFQEMAALGEPVLKPFLQDVVQFPALSSTLFKTALAHPQQVLKVIPHAGLPALLDWMIHYLNLGVYTTLNTIAPTLEPIANQRSPLHQFRWHCWRDAWKYGSGQDYNRDRERSK